jgi:hypothetical protein
VVAHDPSIHYKGGHFMAKTFLNPVFEGFSSSIGNLTFFQRNGKTFSRRKSQPTGEPSSSQMAVRSRFSRCVNDWQSLPAIIKKSWNKAAVASTGYNRFIGVNSTFYMEGKPIRLSEGTGLPAPYSCTGTKGDSGSFSVQYSRPETLEKAVVTVFYRPVPKPDTLHDPFLSVSAESSALGKIDIKDCAPGVQYEVQIVFSDVDILSAGRISPSVSLEIAAGE